MQRQASGTFTRSKSVLLALAALCPSYLADVEPQVEIAVACSEAPEPIALVYGSHTTGGQLQSSIDIDSFTFEASAGDCVRIVVDGQSNNLDPCVELFGPAGFVVSQCCNSDGFGTCSFILEQTLLDGGVYTLILSDNGLDNSGVYQLQLERVCPLGSDPVIGYNEAAVLSINPTTDHDFLRFYGQVGSLLRIAIDGQTNNLDPLFDIVDPSGVVVDTRTCSSGGFGTCSILRDFAPMSNGWHTLVIRDNGADNTGNLSVSVNCLINCPVRVLSQPNNGSGANTACYTCVCPPHIGGVWKSEIATTGHPGASATVFLGYAAGSPGVVTAYGELLVDARSPLVVADIATPTNGVATFRFAVPDDPALAGIEIFTQGGILGGQPELCNAIDVTLGF